MELTVITGNIKAESYLYFTLPSQDGKTKPPIVELVEDGKIKEKLAISANSLRGCLRSKCAEYFLRKLYEKTKNKIDYLTFILYTSGGIITKKDEEKKVILPEEYIKVKKLLDKTLVLSLFGASLPYPIQMIEGKLRVGFAISNLSKENEEKPVEITFAKTAREAEFFEMVEESIADGNSYVKTFEIIRKEKGSKKDDEFLMLKNILGISVIPKGTTFEHTIEIINATDEEVALVLHGLREISRTGLGGMKRLGFGKLSFDYTLYRPKEDPIKMLIKNGKIEIKEDKDKKERLNELFNKLERHYENLSESEWLSFNYEGIEKLIAYTAKAIGSKKKDKKGNEESQEDTD